MEIERFTNIPAPQIPAYTMMVLLVDDQPIIGEAVRRLLAGEPTIELHYCSDPETAVLVANQIRPTVILQDLVMPQMEGLELLSRFRANAATADTPVIVLSTREDPISKSEAFAAGANDYLVKLPDRIELIARIASHSKAYLNRIQRDEAYRALRESQQQLGAANTELVATNRKLQEAMRQMQALHLQVASHNEQLAETVAHRTSELRHALAELQLAQSNLVQQERTNAFGVMASGVAHDFNNILGIALGFAELLLSGGDELSADERRHFTETIISAAQDGARMVNRLREFHRDPENELWERVDLDQLVEQAIQLTRPKWLSQAQRRGAAIEVTADVQPVPFIKGLGAELREMLTNLIFNAADAITGEGTITVRTRADGNQVLVEVADTGSGMTEEVRQRCLDPFFTTKGENGTGMGLAMVYGIAERHGARVEIESEVGRGTTFRFWFPVNELAIEGDAASQLNLARSLKVLVVDDQPFICDILTQYLALDCHVAEAVGDPDEALVRLSEEEFDLLITDQAMPEMSGGELALAAKEISSTIGVILVTGFGADERPEIGAEAIDLVIGKPITQEALRHAIAKCSQRESALPGSPEPTRAGAVQ
jgi:signal transduction histidine kinase